jgi:hypothetical protein
MSMILTEEQLRELEEPGPARAVDPRTNVTYVLLRAELYERLYPLLEEPTTQRIPDRLPPGVQRAKAAFLRDLPKLLLKKAKTPRWVAYHGEDCIANGTSQRELIQHCLQRGLREEELYVGMVVPHAPEPETVDPSLFEAEEILSR